MPRLAPVSVFVAVVGTMFVTTGCGEAPHVTGPISPITAFIGDTVTEELSDNFADADGDEIGYAATSSNPAGVTANVTGTTLRIVPKAKGTTDVIVTATDDHGAVEMTIPVTVGNRAPVVVGPASLERYVSQTGTLSLADHIGDPDGDQLTYEAESSNDGVVLVSVSADILRFEAVARGTATIAVTATDDDSLSVSLDIPATVGPMPGRVALEFLYGAAGGSGWTNSDNWGTDADLSTWYGVEVNARGQVRSLSLGNNNLKGSIAPALGELDALEHLNLESNELTGELPVSLNWLHLSELRISNNAGLAGEFGADSRVAFYDLTVLLAGGTDLCAPNQDRFRSWLERIDERRVKMCEPVSPTAHLIQAAQSRADSVRRIPLVGGKQALLRVFVTSSHSTHDVEIPPVKATFYDDDDEIHTVTIPGKAEPVPVIRAERSLATSANVMIPGEFIRPGLEVVIEIDPERTLDEELGVAARVPEDGRLEYRVYNLSTFDLTMIPFLWEHDPDSAVIDIVDRMAENEEEDSLLYATYDLLPVLGFEVTAHDPVETSSNDLSRILPAVEVIRRRDGGDGYFQGQLTGRLANPILGIAYWPGKSSASVPIGLIMSHELGHNLYLRHAPCGGGDDPDTNFPYTNSKIGMWGYDYRKDELVNPARNYDMMSYCGGRRQWISDYNFDKLIRYRRARSYQERQANSAATQTLLLWGGLDEDGTPYLRPAFVMEARPGLPASSGEYTLTARDHDGTALISLSFDMPKIADAPGESSHFVFTVPVQEGWAGSVASITLSGPAGSVTMDEDTDDAMTIALAGKSGPIRAFWDGLRDPPADRPGWVVLRSSGIPGREEWER